jgi:phosphoglycerol transferase MdoB-like AlkP superfamily enzyme
VGRKIKVISLLFLCLLVFYTLLRLAFYSMYFSSSATDAPVLRIFLAGVQLDFTALFALNLVFLVFYFFVHHRLPASWRNSVALLLFLLLNIPFLALNFIDLGYYGFTARRSTSDIVFVTGDSWSSLPSLLKNYWYLFLLFAATLVLMVWLVKRILKTGEPPAGMGWKQYALAIIVFVISGAIARGFAARPVMPSTPLLYFDARYQPLVSNTTISFIYSVLKRQSQLEIKSYYTPVALDSVFTIRRQYAHATPFRQKNVVVFILESFCREYFIRGHRYKAYTPFLDSLIAQSTWCNDAYANGLSSNQGIVSILGAMPPLLDEPYFHSIYSNNKFKGLGTLLKEHGYSTHFFMGAGPDHFGFGKWSKLAGIDHYYSRKDFNDDRFYDGNWGIYDHRFLPFGASVLNATKPPFLAVLFNISSHHPFTLPPELHDRFQVPGQNEILNSITYVDHSLRLMFDSIKNTTWYGNTLFVFTADHASVGYLTQNINAWSGYRIPIFFHDPANPVHVNIEKPVQQTDIVPTVMDYLHYPRPFMAFGRSVYDTVYNPVINKSLGVINITDSAFILGYNESAEKPVYLYDRRADTGLTHNLLNIPAYAPVQNALLRFNRAVIQRYNNSLIQNQLFIR